MDNAYGAHHRVKAADGKAVAIASRTRPEVDENVRLIAAGPYMLAALEEVQRCLAYVVPRTPADRVRLMRTVATVNAAIAKAE